MSRRRITLWAFVCAFALCLAAGFAAMRLRGPRLPVLEHYDKLPPAFYQALERVRKDVGSDPDGIRRLALLYQANRLYPESRACYRVIAARSGGLAARDHYLLAAIDLDESDLDGARAELGAVLLQEPRYVPARCALAEVLFKTGQAGDAAKEYAAALEAEPDNPQALVGLARAELQKGDDRGALSHLWLLLAHHPESTSGASLLAQVLEREGDTQKADLMRAYSRRTHEPVAPDPWLVPLLADCYDLQRLALAFEQYRLAGQISEALPLLDRLEELDPNGWTAPLLRGWSDKQAGRYDEAVRLYRRSIERGGDPEKICPLIGAALITEGKLSDAAALLADYHGRFPHSVPILSSYCEVAVRRGDTVLARRLLTEVLAEDPYLYMPNMSLVQILWTAGEHDKAAAFLKRVATVYPADVDSRIILGTYYLEKSDPYSATIFLEPALDLLNGAQGPKRDKVVGELSVAYQMAGSLEASQGHLARAVQWSDRSIGLAPGDIRGYALKANCLKSMKDFKHAAVALEKMVSLEPAEPMLRVDLGDALYQSGEKDLALKQWRRALELAPQDASALKKALGLRLEGHITSDLLL